MYMRRYGATEVVLSQVFLTRFQNNLALIGPVAGSAVPAVLFQRGEEAGVERRSVAGSNVSSHVFGLTHAWNRCAHCGVRKNKAQRHLRQRHTWRHALLELFYARNGGF